MITDQLKRHLETVLDQSRLEHSLRVMEYSVKLAQHHHADVEKAEIAGLLHDVAKQFNKHKSKQILMQVKNVDSVLLKQKKLWHAVVGAHYVYHEMGIKDADIYDAIFYHTMGKPDMPILTKIVYVADMIEPGRDAEYNFTAHIREVAFDDLDAALLMTVNHTLSSVLRRGIMMHPSSVAMRNDLLMKEQKTE